MFALLCVLTAIFTGCNWNREKSRVERPQVGANPWNCDCVNLLLPPSSTEGQPKQGKSGDGMSCRYVPTRARSKLSKHSLVLHHHDVWAHASYFYDTPTNNKFTLSSATALHTGIQRNFAPTVRTFWLNFGPIWIFTYFPFGRQTASHKKITSCRIAQFIKTNFRRFSLLLYFNAFHQHQQCTHELKLISILFATLFTFSEFSFMRSYHSCRRREREQTPNSWDEDFPRLLSRSLPWSGLVLHESRRLADKHTYTTHTSRFEVGRRGQSGKVSRDRENREPPTNRTNGQEINIPIRTSLPSDSKSSFSSKFAWVYPIKTRRGTQNVHKP